LSRRSKQRAAQQWHATALHILGTCHLKGIGTTADPQQAVEYFIQAGIAGNQNAFLDAFEVYASGAIGANWESSACFTLILLRQGVNQAEFDQFRRNNLLQKLFADLVSLPEKDVPLSIARAATEVLTVLEGFGSDKLHWFERLARGEERSNKASYIVRFGPANHRGTG